MEKLNYIFLLKGTDAPGYITTEALLVSLVGMGIVYFGLTLIYIVFTFLPKLLQISLKKIIRKSQAINSNSNEKQDMNGEINAAISATIFLYLNELHDEENRILTINKVDKRYSPWSSKIYTVMRFNKKF